MQRGFVARILQAQNADTAFEENMGLCLQTILNVIQKGKTLTK